jgi:hypothetical protein
MPFQDFRQFLDVLRRHSDDIDRPMNLDSDVPKPAKPQLRSGNVPLEDSSCNLPCRRRS